MYFLFFLHTVSCASVITMSSESENYIKLREELISKENSNFFGHDVFLSTKEQEVDQILTSKKIQELYSGYKNSSDFLPSLHFFQAKERIDQSSVFQIIKKLPKGASLHTHLTAGVSVDFIIKNFTYKENLYGSDMNDVYKLKFFDNVMDDSSQWTLINDIRAQQTSEIYDRWLTKQLTLNVDNPEEEYPDAKAVWTKFKKTFTTAYDMVSYKPVFQEYVYQLLQELYDDNVMYTELKGTIMPLYDLDGRNYTNEEFFDIFIKTVDKFKKNNPKFIGARYIHSIYRGVNFDVLQTGLEEIIKMKKIFPDFIAGFDFVGYEEEGKTLLDYSPLLLEARKHLNFFFHAGETNWFGHTDLNLADAILLNSSRIGHGFSITKHPQLLQLAKQRNIPLEICPISNQVLKLNDDPRNHPAAVLMALDYPVVVCNDDPSAWNATGLSYDWYIVFMAMTPQTSGLNVLKQLARNSILYSVMNQEEQISALKQWEEQWEVSMNEILEMYTS